MRSPFSHPRKKIVDCILAPRVLAKRLRDFRTWVLAAYVDVHQPFDLVNRDVLWRILTLVEYSKVRQSDIRPVFWYRECCEVW